MIRAQPVASGTLGERHVRVQEVVCVEFEGFPCGWVYWGNADEDGDFFVC